jgi:hypothetical protein
MSVDLHIRAQRHELQRPQDDLPEVPHRDAADADPLRLSGTGRDRSWTHLLK